MYKYVKENYKICTQVQTHKENSCQTFLKMVFETCFKKANIILKGEETKFSPKQYQI